LGLLLASGCAASLRERTTPFPPHTPSAVPWQLNRELLTAANKRIQIVVEWIDGHEPEREALDDLAALASRYGERPAWWTMANAPEAPRVHWEGDRLVGALEPDVSYVFVRYVGKQLKRFGESSWLRVGDRKVYLILMNQEAHRRWRSLVLPERRLEEQTLIHEYGHLLGLPPCDHGYYVDYPSFAGGAHCVNPDCALSKPRFRALLYAAGATGFRRKFLEDYCEQCRRAITTAKAYWRYAG
jgi:hypothetical protein